MSLTMMTRGRWACAAASRARSRKGFVSLGKIRVSNSTTCDFTSVMKYGEMKVRSKRNALRNLDFVLHGARFLDNDDIFFADLFRGLVANKDVAIGGDDNVSLSNFGSGDGVGLKGGREIQRHSRRQLWNLDSVGLHNIVHDEIELQPSATKGSGDARASRLMG